ncbi:MAG: hypothetical protein ABW063_12210 [Caulobacter sp.]
MQMLVFAAVGYTVYRFAKSRYDRAAQGVIAQIGSDGSSVPVIAAFTGVRGLPWWFAVAVNNANPTLAITPSAVRVKVIRTTEHAMADVELVDVRTAWKTVNLHIRFKGQALTYAANLGSRSLARDALTLLPSHVPMTSRAKALQDGSDVQESAARQPAF